MVTPLLPKTANEKRLDAAVVTLIVAETIALLLVASVDIAVTELSPICMFDSVTCQDVGKGYSIVPTVAVVQTTSTVAPLSLVPLISWIRSFVGLFTVAMVSSGGVMS